MRSFQCLLVNSKRNYKIPGLAVEERDKILAIQMATGKAVLLLFCSTFIQCPRRGILLRGRDGFKGGKLEHSYALSMAEGVRNLLHRSLYFVEQNIPTS